MKVSELKQGMLLKPRPGCKILIQPGYAFFRKEKLEKKIVVAEVVSFENCPKSWLENHGVSSVIYLGSQFDQFVYDGVFKHHRVLAGDTIATISGYKIKDLCSAGEL